jgi:hypothetical protein
VDRHSLQEQNDTLNCLTPPRGKGVYARTVNLRIRNFEPLFLQMLQGSHRPLVLFHECCLSVYPAGDNLRVPDQDSRVGVVTLSTSILWSSPWFADWRAARHCQAAAEPLPCAREWSFTSAFIYASELILTSRSPSESQTTFVTITQLRTSSVNTCDANPLNVP